MLWSDLGVLLAGLTILGRGPYAWERAAQLGVLGLCMDATRRTWLHGLMLGPAVWCVAVAAAFELARLHHARRYATQVQTWEHIQRLRAQQDLSTLLALKLGDGLHVSGAEWQQHLEAEA